VIALLAACWLAFSFGVWMLVVAPREPSIAEELSLLGGAAPVSGWSGLVEGVGKRTAGLWSRAGQRSEALEADLAVLGKTPAQHYGQKVAGGVILLLAIPVMGLVGVPVSLPTAAVWSLALGAVGFFAPNFVVPARAKQARQELRDGVAELAVLMSLAVSAGAGIDSAFRGALEASPGRFAQELGRARNVLPRATVRRVIDDVADCLGVPEAASLASAIGASEHGAAVGDALDELAWAMVETRRFEATQAGVRARTRGVVVATGLMVPGYLILVAFPPVRLALKALTGT
jgi:Flp pilus assembly protein TadB